MQRFINEDCLHKTKLTFMKKLFLILIGCFMVVSAANAQTAAKAMYFELGGPGFASLNYDQRFKKKEDGLGFRVGLGYAGTDGVGALTVPVGLTYLLGKDEKNYFELGGGITYVSVKESDPFDDDEIFDGTFGHLNFGYRMAPKKGGFFFRAAINPVFGDGYFFPFYGGIAFGYKF